MNKVQKSSCATLHNVRVSNCREGGPRDRKERDAETLNLYSVTFGQSGGRARLIKMKQANSYGLGALLFFQSADVRIDRYASRTVRTGPEEEIRFGAEDGPLVVAIRSTPGPHGPTLLLMGEGDRLLHVAPTNEKSWTPTKKIGVSTLRLGPLNEDGGLEILRRHQGEDFRFFDPESGCIANGAY